MLTSSVTSAAAFTRRDAVRLGIAVGALVAVLTVVLAVDLLPKAAFTGGVGDLAPEAVYAPRATTYTSQVATEAARADARRTVDFVYDYSPASGQLSAAQQLAAFDRLVAPIDAAFGAVLSDEARLATLETAVEGLTPTAVETLKELDAEGWTALRLELANVLDAAQRQEVRDTDLPSARAALATRVSLDLPGAATGPRRRAALAAPRGQLELRRRSHRPGTRAGRRGRRADHDRYQAGRADRPGWCPPDRG